jgi:S1-C subfamily serine protease
MRVEFRITSGSRAGQREGFDKDLIKIGRLASNDLKFHPENDPDVSSNHAEIRIAGNTATLRDLGSTNGTFVNGQRVQGERGLGNGDVISFGESGPKVEVIAPELARPSAPRRDTSMRIAEAVEAQTGMMKKMIGGLAVLVVVGVGVAFYLGNRGANKQIAQLIAQNDSLGKMFATMRGKSASIDSALDAEHRRNEDLTRRLESARKSGDASTVTQLSAEVQNNANRQRGLANAAAVDWQTVNARNAPAMAFLVVEMEDGTKSSGTGFNVHPSGLIVTNRHVIQDEKGRRAKRIAVRFENTLMMFKGAVVVKVSETDELAWLRIDGGPYPVVQGIARDGNVRVGAPMALIGYPLGTGTAGMSSANINDLRPSSTQTLGAVSKVLPDILQLDVFAAQGSSGSPVFNADGLVIGVLYGSPTESGGRIIYAVPAAKLIAQMPPEGAAIVK